MNDWMTYVNPTNHEIKYSLLFDIKLDHWPILSHKWLKNGIPLEINLIRKAIIGEMEMKI